jgi:multiple sugar transport system substrate-binding protein
MTVARPLWPWPGCAALASVLVPCLVAACTGPSASEPKEIVLELWAMGREGEVVTELMPEFERLHPGIRVEVQQIPWSAAHEKLLTAFVGDATPDVAQLGNTWIPEFAALGALEALEPAVTGSAIVQPDDYFSGIWETNVFEGRLYGVPWYVDTRLLFYRRDLLAAVGFDAPPASWSEWMEMLAAIKQHMGPDHYAILLPLNEFDPLLALALQQDEPLLREDGRWGNFRSQGFRRALAFYLEMFRRDLAPPATNTQIANVWNEFGRGYFSFYISGPWYIGEFKRRLPAEQQDIWMTAPLPGPDGPGASTAGGASLVVFSASRRKQAAWQLIEYLSRPDVQLRFNALTGNLPPRRSTWSDERLAGDVHARAFREQLERVEPSPRVPEWERIATEMRIVAEQAVHDNLSVDAAAAELDARADRILEKRRWILARRSAE